MSINQFFYTGDTTSKFDFADVLLAPSLIDASNTEVKSRADVSLEVTYQFPHSETTYTGVPIIAANMDNIGTFKVHDVFSRNNMCVALTKTTTIEQWKMHFDRNLLPNNNTAMVSIGLADSDLDMLSEIVKHTPVKFICMDVANGYLPAFARQIEKVRKLYPKMIIVAGNVVTPDAIEVLHRAGADCYKVGIGSGSVCSTRLIAGTGFPQLSALMECYDKVYELGGHMVSDGGCTNAGDFAKALVTSSFVMSGGFFAGYNETGTTLYGMSSTKAMNIHQGGVAKHRTSEGHEINLPKSNGPLQDRIDQLLGGLRSACTYQNVNNLIDFKQKASFVRVNQHHNTMFYK